MSGTTIANVKGGNIANTKDLTDRVKKASTESALLTLVTLNDKLGSNSSNGTLKIVNTTNTSQDLKFVRKERWFFSTSLSQDRNTKTREAVVALFDKASDGMANKQEFMANVQNVLHKNEGIKNISSLMGYLTSHHNHNQSQGQDQSTGDANALLQSVRLSSPLAVVQDVKEQPLNADAGPQSDALHHDQVEQYALLEHINMIEESSPRNSRSSLLRSTVKNGQHVSGYLDWQFVHESGLQNVRSTMQRQVSVSAESLLQPIQGEGSYLDDNKWGVNDAFEDFMDPNSVGRDSTHQVVNNLDAKQMMRALDLKNAIGATQELLGDGWLERVLIESNTDTNDVLDQHDKWFKDLYSQIQNRALGLHADQAFLEIIHPPVAHALETIDNHLARLDDFKAPLGDAQQRLLKAGRDIPDEQKPTQYAQALLGLNRMLDLLDKQLSAYAERRSLIQDDAEVLKLSMLDIGSNYLRELSEHHSRNEQTLRNIQNDSQSLTAQIRDKETSRQKLRSPGLVDPQVAERLNGNIQDLKHELNKIDYRLGQLAENCSIMRAEIAEYGMSDLEDEPWRQLEAKIEQARALNQSQNEGLQLVVVSAPRVETAKSVPLNEELTKLLSGIKTIDKTSATQRLKEVGDSIRDATALATKLNDQLHPGQAQQLVRLLSPGGGWRDYLNQVYREFDAARRRDLASMESSLDGLTRSLELAVEAKQLEQLTQSDTSPQKAKAVRDKLMQMPEALNQEFETTLRDLQKLQYLDGKDPTKNVAMNEVTSEEAEVMVANFEKLQKSVSAATSQFEKLQQLLPPDSLDASTWLSVTKAMDEFLPNTSAAEYLSDDLAEDVVELPKAMDEFLPNTSAAESLSEDPTEVVVKLPSDVLSGIRDQLRKAFVEVEVLDMAALRAPLSQRELELNVEVQTRQKEVSAQQAQISALNVERSRGKAEFDALLTEAKQFIARVRAGA